MKSKILNVLRDSVKILVLVLLICLIYKLNIFSIFICVLGAVIFQIFFEKEEKIRKKYLDKFHDVVLYMEQMIYSFKKQPKIRMALSDAQKVCSNHMKEMIEEVILNIDSKMTENIYEESLEVLKSEYDCKRLWSLHEFIIKIEKHGGDYENYIDILLEDIKEWGDRVSLYIKSVDRIKRNVLISIISTLVTCGFMAYLIPGEYRYTEHFIYQICTTTMIILMLASYLFVHKKMNIDWILDRQTLPDNMIVKYYVLTEKAYNNYSSLSVLEKMSYKKAKRTLEKEIKKVFPDWIRDVAINLQNETVQSAIEESYGKLPFVLKRPVRKLLVDFEKFPVGIEPYDNFLKEFDLDEIKSSVKMFYSINELGKWQSDKQINAIIDRNNKMISQAEEMKNSDKIGASTMFSAIPMVLGVVKIMVDMILMIVVFTSSVSNVINGG
ncbi:MAG: hypothetical protein HFG31_00255 [Eubacterium sp.]|nr:hypothetical protein [Eubacterium sp.]